MPPTIPESDFEAMEDIMEAPNNDKYVYDIKFEVVLKEELETIPGKASLLKSLRTIKKIKRQQEKIDFYDTSGLQISPDLLGIDEKEIGRRFCVETGGMNNRSLFFACTIHTNITFAEIKGRTIKEFKTNNIYLKIHRGGFKYGVNWSPIGFFVKMHPGFVSRETLKDDVMDKIHNSWEQNDDGFFDDDQKMKIIKVIEDESNLNTFDPKTIPFEIIQSSIMAKNSENETIRANALVVTVPFQFYKVGITIMDYLVITSEKIDNYIPIGYKKEDPENFYNIVNNHSIWINKTRHAIIKNVPTIKHLRGEVNHEGYTLEKLLKNIPDIENISYNPIKKQITVAVTTQKMIHVTRKIDGAITSAEFTYKPQVAKKFNPTGSLGSTNSGTSKYSAAMKKHQVNLSPNSSVATSIDDTKMTRNTGWSWATQKKIPREIDFSDATEFPTLPTKTRPKSPTINDESITDTTVIQQAIDLALKKAYEDHRKELEAMQEAMQDKFNKQLQIIQQQNSTSTLEKKFDSLLELLLKDTPTIQRESPIRKKGKPTNLEETTFSQIDTPTRSNTNKQTSESNHDDDMEIEEIDPQLGPQYHPLPPSPQRNTGNEEPHSMTVGISDTVPEESEWITKEKKDRRFPKPMTQTKIFDTMPNGGYGESSPLRRHPQTPPRPIPNTPSRKTGKGGTPPRPVQAEKGNGSKVKLTTLSSSRSGQNTPHGREN